jgi:hypothetical protein
MKEYVRQATAEDVKAMVALSERERLEREKIDLEFFRKAERSVEAGND